MNAMRTMVSTDVTLEGYAVKTHTDAVGERVAAPSTVRVSTVLWKLRRWLCAGGCASAACAGGRRRHFVQEGSCGSRAAQLAWLGELMLFSSHHMASAKT